MRATKVKFDNPPAAFKTWEIVPGCYVDGARGIYAIDAIVSLAEQYGFVAPVCDCDVCSGKAEGSNVLDSPYAGCEYVNDLEDEIDSFLNDQFAVAGYVWGRSENGDYGLWALDGDE